MGEVLAALKNDTSHATKMIEDFEMQLRVLQDEELLEKWSEYINWTQQYFISSNQETLNLMKRCVKHFKSKLEFRSHDKFVKIWIKISEMTIEADDIFRYMCDQEIGTSSALLYKEWAKHHEIVGNVKRAEEIYTLGINRNADPVEELKQLRSQFDWRQMKKVLSKEGDEDEKPDGAESSKKEEEQCRSALTSLPATKSGKVNSKRPKLQDITHSHGSAGLGASKTSKNRKISSASVFEVLDESKELAKNKDLPTSTLYSSTSGTLNKRLPFHNEKENVMALGTLKNTKIKSTRPISTSSKKTSFFIYKDEEAAPSEPDNPDDSGPVFGSEEVTQPVTIVSRKPLNSITNQPTVDMLQDLEQDGGDTKSVCMYQKDMVYMGNSEVSPEELRAQLAKYKCPTK